MPELCIRKLPSSYNQAMETALVSMYYMLIKKTLYLKKVFYRFHYRGLYDTRL